MECESKNEAKADESYSSLLHWTEMEFEASHYYKDVVNAKLVRFNLSLSLLPSKLFGFVYIPSIQDRCIGPFAKLLIIWNFILSISVPSSLAHSLRTI